jgi:hypothetical protein
MTAHPQAPFVVRGGFVFLDPDTGRVQRVIPFQYNPDSLTRTLQVQGAGDEQGDRLEALRLKGPPQESYKFEAELDAIDQLDKPGEHPLEAAHGLYPMLSALELGIYPTSDQLRQENASANDGILEIAPIEAPLMLLVLGAKRVLPVRITELSITEEAFDTALNPIRAKVSVGVRVLTVDDVGFEHKAGRLYLRHHQRKEQFAAMVNHGPSAVGNPEL